MKYSHFILISVILTISFYVPVFSQFGGGSGTETDPYRIYTKEHLENINDSLNVIIDNNYSISWTKGKYFKLMNDITDSVRTIIGYHLHKNPFGSNYFYRQCFFEGNFDGQGHTITLAINNDTNRKYAALFGFLSEHALIKNLAVTGYVNGNTDNYVGGIAGVATMNAKIMNCINSAEIIGTGWTGGIVGQITGGIIIEKCINIGTVRNLGNSRWNDFAVFGIIDAAGGIVGINFHNSYTGITNCINSGFIEGNDCVGGIVGCNLYAKISNCLNTGVVKGNTKVGCIVGENQGGTIINCHYDKQMCGGGK
jgi:hypothetical protein